MGYFPFFVDVEKLHGVIVGGGNIALEKVERLVPFNAKLTLVASNIDDRIKQYACAYRVNQTANEDVNEDGIKQHVSDDKINQRAHLQLIEREYRSEDLDDADYVIAATNISTLNEQIRRDARKRGLLVNVVDVTDSCDFIFPSVVKRGRLVVGVSSSGAGPQVAIRLRKEIEKVIPDDIEDILDFLAEERIRAKKEIPDSAERKKYLIGLADKLLNHENQQSTEKQYNT